MNDATMSIDLQRIHEAEPNRDEAVFEMHCSGSVLSSKNVFAKSGIDLKTIQELKEKSTGHYGYRFAKRCFDIVFSLLALIVLSP